MSVIDKDLAAGGEVLGSYDPTPLFAGDAPIVTSDDAVVASGEGKLAKYTVVAKVSGKLVALDPAGVDGSEVADGILTQAVDATSADAKVARYKAGYFNHEALVWPAALDTLAERIAAFEGSQIFIGKVGL